MVGHSPRVFIILALLPTLLASCLEYREVELKSFDGVMLNGISAKNLELSLSATIHNPNNYNIKVRNPDIDVFVEGFKVGKLDMEEALVLKKESEQQYTIPILTSVDGEIASLLPLLMIVFSKDRIDIQAKGDFKATAKLLSKRVDVDIEQKVDLRR